MAILSLLLPGEPFRHLGVVGARRQIFRGAGPLVHRGIPQFHRRTELGGEIAYAKDKFSVDASAYIGDDEAEAGEGRIGWNSPLARALRGAKRTRPQGNDEPWGADRSLKGYVLSLR